MSIRRLVDLVGYLQIVDGLRDHDSHAGMGNGKI